jgi:hypothetical protein
VNVAIATFTERDTVRVYGGILGILYGIPYSSIRNPYKSVRSPYSSIRDPYKFVRSSYMSERVGFWGFSYIYIYICIYIYISLM